MGADMDKLFKYPGYTAVLPPRVRYDQTLPDSAKLLYAEVTAMSDVTGYCWATNAYLARLLGITKGRASKLLAQLEERGYIEIQVIKTEKGGVEERRIFLTDLGLVRLPPPIQSDEGMAKNSHTPMVKNSHTPMAKNSHTTMNDNNINNPPIVPQGGRRRNEHKTTADWRPEDFERLWVWYPGTPELHSKRGSRQRAIRAWDQLHASPELVSVIAAALAAQAETDKDWREGIGIPHLSTYLNGYRWEGWEDAQRAPERPTEETPWT